MNSKNILGKLLGVAAICFSFNAMNADEVAFTQTYTVDNPGAALDLVIKKAALVRNIDNITAKMDIDLSEVKVKSNEAAIFTPMIVNGEDTLRLPGVGVYGRNRWYQFERMERLPLSGEGEQSFRVGKVKNPVKYSQSAEYESWMNGAVLKIERVDYGCASCHGPIINDPADIAMYRVETYEPQYDYKVAMVEAIKTRELTGRAYVDFPVNLITIYPDYRRNSVELAKIVATIDSIRNDKDITVKSLTIKGFASPEGPYDNNVRLAKGRTEALKTYVQNLYSFPYGFIQTSYEPEDWEGLREYVMTSTLPHRDGILSIIDSPMAPDTKNSKIQEMYPEEYDFLLQTVYPGLRHSDYTIEYEIRGFSDVAEIAEVMRTNPAKLSLNEMYLLAATYDPSSPEYYNIMETAVMLYPGEEVAILNAAQAAMQRGDLNSADRFMAKAGTSADALYTRGILAGLRGDYNKAIWYLEQAQAKGNPDAAAELEKMKLAKQFSPE
ncbi:MAG: DUF3868 domain-containing protein [Muribaculaceae bacterium]|nr:DUF3868 domain-containing protein [Muribaculaceae bacterium]